MYLYRRLIVLRSVSDEGQRVEPGESLINDREESVFEIASKSPEDYGQRTQ